MAFLSIEERLHDEIIQLKAEKASLVVRINELTDRHTQMIVGHAGLGVVQAEAARIVAKEARELREIAQPIADAIPDATAGLRVESVLLFAATSLENVAKLLGVDPRTAAPSATDGPNAEVIVLSERIGRPRATVYQLQTASDGDAPA